VQHAEPGLDERSVVRRLGHAIGDDQTGVAAAERHRVLFEAHVGKQTEGRPASIQAEAAGPAKQKSAWMAGVAVGKTAPLQIKHTVESGNELIRLQNFVQEVINSGEDGLDRIVISDLGAQESAETCHDQRSRNAFPGDVGDDNAKVALNY